MDQIKIGKFIQLLRKEKNLTQAQLADKLGVSDRTVSKWENGRGLPDYQYVQDLCTILEISFNELMAGERIETSDNETKLEQNLISAYKDSRNSERKLFTVRTVLLTLLAVLIIIGGAFAIDVHQMKNNKPVVFSTWGFKYYPPVDLHELQLEQGIKDFISEEQKIIIEKRNLENAKGFVEINTFLIEANKDDMEYKVSCWVLEKIYCEKDGEIIEECGSSIPYLFVLDRVYDSNEYRVVLYFQPKDGSLYEKSLKEIFSSSVVKQIKDFNMSNEILKLKYRIEQDAKDYYGVNE